MNVDWIGMTQLRTMNAARLRELEQPAIVRGRADEPPLAVLIPYALFMQWQEMIKSVEDEVFVLTDKGKAVADMLARQAEASRRPAEKETK